MNRRNFVRGTLGAPLAAATPAVSASTWTVTSPDRKILVTVKKARLDAPYPAGEENLYFSVRLNGKLLIEDSPLGVTMDGPHGNFVNNLKFVKQSSSIINEAYELKTSPGLLSEDRRMIHIKKLKDNMERGIGFDVRLQRTVAVKS